MPTTSRRRRPRRPLGPRGSIGKGWLTAAAAPDRLVGGLLLRREEVEDLPATVADPEEPPEVDLLRRAVDHVGQVQAGDRLERRRVA